MRVLYIDPIGGLAGDMLCASLFDLGLDFDAWKKELEKLHIPLPKLELRTVQRGVFRAAYFSVINPKSSSETLTHHHSHQHSHHHSHEHSHEHSHQHKDLSPIDWEDSHRSWKDIQGIIKNSDLSLKVKENSYRIFEKLAQSEARMHGMAI